MINQFINQQCGCDDALSFFMGFNSLETQLYFTLVQQGKKTISELCNITDRNQSTVYNAIEKLVSHGICTKTKRSRSPRGYEYVYDAIPPSHVKKLLLDRLDQLYGTMRSCIQTFDTDALVCQVNF